MVRTAVQQGCTAVQQWLWLGSAHAAGGLENILLAALSPLSLKIDCIGNTNFLL